MRTAAKHAVSTSWMISDRSGFRFTRSNQAAGSQKSDLGHGHCQAWRRAPCRTTRKTLCGGPYRPWVYFIPVTLPALSSLQLTFACRTSMPPCLA